MVRELTRRMRCDVQGCHKVAKYGIGAHSIDYPLCEKHFRMLVEEGAALINKPVEVVPKDPIVESEEIIKNPEPAEGGPVDHITPVILPKSAAPKTDAAEEFYTCKYCGEKFSKNEMTTAQFMAHCRSCKKEHSA